MKSVEKVIWDLEKDCFSFMNLKSTQLLAPKTSSGKIDMINVDESVLDDIRKYMNFYHKFDKCHVSITIPSDVQP